MQIKGNKSRNYLNELPRKVLINKKVSFELIPGNLFLVLKLCDLSKEIHLKKLNQQLKKISPSPEFLTQIFTYEKVQIGSDLLLKFFLFSTEGNVFIFLSKYSAERK